VLWPHLTAIARARARTDLLAVTLLALLILPHPPVWAQEQGKDQQKCINQVNKNFAKVAEAQGKEACECIKRASKGLLQGQTVEGCMTADGKGKLARARQKTLAKELSSCGTLPDFGYTSAANANEAAMGKELSLVHLIFGADLDTGIISEFMFQNGARCQHAVAEAAKACHDAKLDAFNGCKKAALKGKRTPAVTSAEELRDTCLGTGTDGMPDPKGKIRKTCVDKLGKTISKRCTGKEVDLTVAFGGVSDPDDGDSLRDLVDQVVECQVCRAITQADGLSRDCDLFDDGVANASCVVLALP